jgi:hypothetical protein
MRLSLALLPQEIINQYQLKEIAHNGLVHLRIERGMYGLPQAGRLAHDQLVRLLQPHGYTPCKRTPGLWKHSTRPILFSLVVDDFGIKYVGREHADHLLQCLSKHYKVSTDWEGKRYCGITLDWNYPHEWVELSMPGYVKEALHCFQHPTPATRTDAPSHWTAPSYGRKVQLTQPADNTKKMTAEDIKRLQTVVGKFLFYCRAVDPTMQHALSVLATQQTTGTQRTLDELTRLLNYCASNPDAKLKYRRSDMVLRIESDASYLTEPGARSRAGGFFYLGREADSPPF